MTGNHNQLQEAPAPAPVATRCIFFARQGTGSRNLRGKAHVCSQGEAKRWVSEGGSRLLADPPTLH
eukprot:2618427-Heterocapsa_arctica.AAC.1